MEIMAWIILAIVFAVLEIVTIGLTSIWFAGGALLALLAAALGSNIIGQIIIFVVSSVILLLFTRPWAMKYVKPHLVKTNYEGKIGKDACVTETVDNRKETGTAILEGQEWRVRASNEEEVFEPGTLVTVEEIRGVTLYVKESSRMPEVK